MLSKYQVFDDRTAADCSFSKDCSGKGLFRSFACGAMFHRSCLVGKSRMAGALGPLPARCRSTSGQYCVTTGFSGTAINRVSADRKALFCFSREVETRQSSFHPLE